ncbi:MAG TPA: superoxide dismutase, partial [Catenuloplanes sp.]
VYDGATGAQLAQYAFGGTFVNDAVVTSSAAYFTDSYRPVLHSVPLGAAGRLPGQSAVRTIELTGDLAEQGAFNNGIEATPDGRLLVVQMIAGRLIAYDPRTGVGTRVDLRGASVLQGDGLLRRGRILYVVRNFANVIAKFRLNDQLTTATLLQEITSPAFDIPATVTALGPWLYAVNARFNVEQPTPQTTYNVIRVRG